MSDYTEIQLPNNMVCRTWVDGSGKVAYLKSVDSYTIYHRDDGPAIIDPLNSLEEWYFMGLVHREDGPAIISKEHKVWYNFGKLHRIDGPAIVDKDGEEYWFITGDQYTFNEWSSLVTGVLTDEQLVEVSLKYS